MSLILYKLLFFFICLSKLIRLINTHIVGMPSFEMRNEIGAYPISRCSFITFSQCYGNPFSAFGALDFSFYVIISHKYMKYWFTTEFKFTVICNSNCSQFFCEHSKVINIATGRSNFDIYE